MLVAVPCPQVATVLITVWMLWTMLVGSQVDSPGVYLQNGNRLLRIYRVQSEHGGQFACTAENTAGEARRAYNIVVQGELRTTIKTKQLIR